MYIIESFSNGVLDQQRLQNILISRTDRIGDVILTLPTIEALKSNFPAGRITVLVSSYTAELVEDVADSLLYDKEGIKKPFFEILAELRRLKFDTAIIVYPRFRIALLLCMAGIPLRVGTGYRWYSFLFNKKLFEHRKTVEKHEAEYDLSLIKILGCKIPSDPKIHINISEQEKSAAGRISKTLGIPENTKLVLLHPGSGGSAREWKPERFIQLAKELKQRGFFLVITGSKAEEKLVNKVAQDTGPGVVPFVSTLKLKEFAAFIQQAKLFVANSTGPLHIAAAVGTPVVGFYPPVLVMSPKRWGPLTDKKVIFVPDPAQCPRCKGGRCRGNECMDQIEVLQVTEKALKLMNGD